MINWKKWFHNLDFKYNPVQGILFMSLLTSKRLIGAFEMFVLFRLWQCVLCRSGKLFRTEHFNRQGRELLWSGESKKKNLCCRSDRKEKSFEYSFCLHLTQKQHLPCRKPTCQKSKWWSSSFSLQILLRASLLCLTYLLIELIIHQTPMRQ